MRPVRRHAERGAALLVVLFVMMSLLGLGMTALWMTSGNLQVAGNLNLRTQALYCAEAGVERAQAFLNTATADGASAFLTSLLPGTRHALDAVPTALDGATGKPNGVGAVLVVEGGEPLANVSFPPASFGRAAGTATAPVAMTMGTYTVWIRNDTGESRRGLLTTDANQTVVIRSQGTAIDGRTTAVVEVTYSARPTAAARRIFMECLDTGKNIDDANTNTAHCSRNN